MKPYVEIELVFWACDEIPGRTMVELCNKDHTKGGSDISIAVAMVPV